MQKFYFLCTVVILSFFSSLTLAGQDCCIGSCWKDGCCPGRPRCQNQLNFLEKMGQPRSCRSDRDCPDRYRCLRCWGEHCYTCVKIDPPELQCDKEEKLCRTAWGRIPYCATECTD
jgi:hypothetical protein